MNDINLKSKINFVFNEKLKGHENEIIEDWLTSLKRKFPDKTIEIDPDYKFEKEGNTYKTTCKIIVKYIPLTNEYFMGVQLNEEELKKYYDIRSVEERKSINEKEVEYMFAYLFEIYLKKKGKLQ